MKAIQPPNSQSPSMIFVNMSAGVAPGWTGGWLGGISISARYFREVGRDNQGTVSRHLTRFRRCLRALMAAAFHFISQSIIADLMSIQSD